MTRLPTLVAPPVTIPCVVLIAVIAGCVSAPPPPTAEDHAQPAHHPGAFLQAIDAIEDRAAVVGAGGDATARCEFADIVRWLPMLAADTELCRADWDRVQDISVALAGDIEAPGSRPPEGFFDRCREAVAGLRNVASKLPETSTAGRGPKDAT